MKTVFVGQFQNGKMVAGKPSKIIGERCHRGIKEIKVAKTNPDSATMKYNLPTRIRIGDQPRLMDPYEKRHLYIQSGAMGDGVFAKTYINEGDIIAYYSGVLSRARPDRGFLKNQTWEEL